ncbi:MAG: glycosyltransferase [Bacteroidales bacterium]|nr:glycosyltransferase [Bacteroidales bacterium]
MKILQVCNKFPYPPKDGGAIAKFNLLKGLSSLGHDLTVLAMNTNKHYFDVKNMPPAVKNLAVFVDVYTNTRLAPLKALGNLLFSALPYNAVRFITPGFKRKLIETLQQDQFDVVQLEGLYLCPYIKDIRANSKALVAYRAHNIEHEIWQRVCQHEPNVLKKAYLKILARRIEQFEKSFVNQYDLLVPITKRDAASMKKMGCTKPVHICPTGTYGIAQPASTAKPQPASFFHLGGLDWPPNQAGLLWFVEKIWPHVLAQLPMANFFIAGRNAPNSFVKAIANKKGVCYVGEVEDAHLFMAGMAVMVVPLLSGSGMRIKIVEGMANGKAIVSTSIGAEGIDATNNKEIVIADTESDFISSMVKLGNSPNMVEDLGKKAREYVLQNFDNSKISSSLATFYKQHLQ